MIIATLSVGVGVLTLELGNTFELGCFFKYKPYIPKKRKITKKTAKGSFTQTSTPLFVHGTEFIDFSYDLLDADTVRKITEIYNLDENLTFTGHYNDEYLVEFTEWMPEPKSGYFKATGKFRILCEISGFSPQCQ